MNSWERQVIHSYCEENKIDHESLGEGIERYIVIRKQISSKKEVVQEEVKEVLVDSVEK